MFKDMLHSDESLFTNVLSLEYDFVPKLIPYREKQQKHIAMCIKPLFNNRNGRNLLLHGLPGIGKTVACKHLFNELEDETEEIVPMYINCWKHNSSYKIATVICELLGYKMTMNKKTDELFDIATKILNKKSAVFCFDEIDKLEDFDFLYHILENIYRKTIILISNYKEWFAKIDERIKSRLTAELLEFKPYNKVETDGILKERIKYGFVPGVWEENALSIIVDKAFELKDVRSGLYLLKESGTIAEDHSSRKINISHVKKAIEKLDEFTINDPEQLKDEQKLIFEIVKDNSGNKIGDLFKVYTTKGGKRSYKSFHRMIKKLEKDRFVSLTKVTGKEGNTTIVKYSGEDKKLTEF